uniref:Uncharacterized protein n=1 Tax=Oryza punctata TaxID=4537 RepID=A0A0E0LRM4_ORYPU
MRLHGAYRHNLGSPDAHGTLGTLEAEQRDRDWEEVDAIMWPSRVPAMTWSVVPMPVVSSFYATGPNTTCAATRVSCPAVAPPPSTATSRTKIYCGERWWRAPPPAQCVILVDITIYFINLIKPKEV